MHVESPLHVAWIGLGSNLDGPAAHLTRAIADLRAASDLRLLALSSYFDTAPVGGPPDQPSFCNACAALATTRSPWALLDLLQAIENRHGRVRDIRWGPRTLDLDLLAFNARQIEDPRLSVPHPRAHQRAFVLAPLAQIAPAVVLANGQRVIDSLAAVDMSGVALRGDA